MKVYFSLIKTSNKNKQNTKLRITFLSIFLNSLFIGKQRQHFLSKLDTPAKLQFKL